jgi:hypothetical protein
MSTPKIQLSQEELEMVQDTHWLLTKNKILEKVFAVFGALAEEMREAITKADIPFKDEVLLISPKISKGENYNGLPYVMLDYPRRFAKEEVMAIRTMFWWGNFISITWHLKGKYKEYYRSVINENRDLLISHNFHISISEDEWRHDFSGENYRQLGTIDKSLLEETLANNSFCKLSVKIPLHQWNEAKEMLVDLYQVLLKMISH